jgi:spore maturation protein CgeB
VRRALWGRYAAEYNAAISSLAQHSAASALLTIKGSCIHPRTLENLRSRGVRTVNYYPDYHFAYREFDEATLEAYDRIFTTKSYHVPYLVRRLGAERVTFLAHGYSSDVHRPATLTEEDRRRLGADVCLVGTASPHKRRLVAALRRELPRLDLKIWGTGWDEAARDPLLAPCIQGYAITGTAYAKAVGAAKINLAVHHGPHAATGWQDLVSTRSFEIPAARGFMLHVDNGEIREYFEPGVEIGVFAGESEVCDAVRRYLPDEQRRHEMIERAYRRCVPAYSYDERVRVIDDALRAPRAGAA